MFKFIIGIMILLFLGCAAQQKTALDDISMSGIGDDELFMAELDSNAMLMAEPTNTSLLHAIAAAEETIDSLNALVSGLEWKVFAVKYPEQARKVILEADGWTVYVVKSGDTLSGIAYELFGSTDCQLLWELNKDVLINPNLLNVGKVLKILRSVSDTSNY